MRDPLHAAADDGQRQGVRSGQQPRRQCGAASGAQGGDVRAVHDDQRRSGLRIEETDQRLVTGQTARGVAVERGDEFDPHRAAGEPAGHGAQESVWRVDAGAPRRHDVPPLSSANPWVSASSIAAGSSRRSTSSWLRSSRGIGASPFRVEASRQDSAYQVSLLLHYTSETRDRRRHYCDSRMSRLYLTSPQTAPRLASRRCGL